MEEQQIGAEMSQDVEIETVAAAISEESGDFEVYASEVIGNGAEVLLEIINGILSTLRSKQWFAESSKAKDAETDTIPSEIEELIDQVILVTENMSDAASDLPKTKADKERLCAIVDITNDLMQNLVDFMAKRGGDEHRNLIHEFMSSKKRLGELFPDLFDWEDDSDDDSEDHFVPTVPVPAAVRVEELSKPFEVKPKHVAALRMSNRAAFKKDRGTSSADDAGFWKVNRSKMIGFCLALFAVAIGIGLYSMWPPVSVDRLVGDVQSKLDFTCKAHHKQLIDIRRKSAAGEEDESAEVELLGLVQRELKTISKHRLNLGLVELRLRRVLLGELGDEDDANSFASQMI